MLKLIVELKDDHQKITNTLKAVNDLGIGTPEGRRKFMDAKELLLAHLQKEDDQLYPVLRKAAQKNVELEETLNVFSKDIQVISKAAIHFFEKYSDQSEGPEFITDYGHLITTLGVRIHKEETILYQEYEKLQR